MKPVASVAIILSLCMSLPGCGGPGAGSASPDEIYNACMAAFERKGGSEEMGKKMCNSMKRACEADPASEDCKKAQRIVEKS